MAARFLNQDSLINLIIVCCQILTLLWRPSIRLHHPGTLWQPDTERADKKAEETDIAWGQVLHASTCHSHKRYPLAECHS